MPRLLAIGNMIGASSTIAGTPSRTQPSTMNTAIETSMKPNQPPGRFDMYPVSWNAKPVWVSAQAIAEAVPRIIRIAPLSAAVSTSMS